MIRRNALVVLLLAAALACAAPRGGAPEPATSAAAPPVAAAPASTGPDRSQVPALGPAPELTIPAQRHFALANGLKVRLVEYRRLPVVAVNLLVGAGGARDPASLPGLASFTAAMITEGTKTRSAIQLSDETNFLGASLRASASPDAAAVAGAVLAKHLGKYLELFADVTMNPSFPRADFERVQDQRLVTLLQQRDQPQPIASKAFIPVFWGRMPYGHYLLGDEAAVKATRPRDLAEFHARHYRPENAELVVVGDVSEAELKPLLEATLGRWKRGAAPRPLLAKPPSAPHRTILVEKPDAPQSYLLAGMPGVERSSPDFVAASVAFQVLGGGSSSRLFRNLREEKGYTYGVYAMGDARRLAGVSLVAGSVKADVTGAALKEILGELARLRCRARAGAGARGRQGRARARAARGLRHRRGDRRARRRARAARAARRLLERLFGRGPEGGRRGGPPRRAAISRSGEAHRRDGREPGRGAAAARRAAARPHRGAARAVTGGWDGASSGGGWALACPGATSGRDDLRPVRMFGSGLT